MCLNFHEFQYIQFDYYMALSHVVILAEPILRKHLSAEQGGSVDRALDWESRGC